MKKINLNGMTAENITGILVLLLALMNAVLQIFGINALPIENAEVSNIISTIFLIGTTLWNTWKNRNITSIAQETQQIADALRSGELLEKDLKELRTKIRNEWDDVNGNHNRIT